MRGPVGWGVGRGWIEWWCAGVFVVSCLLLQMFHSLLLIFHCAETADGGAERRERGGRSREWNLELLLQQQVEGSI